MEKYKVNIYFNEESDTLNDLISKFLINNFDEVFNLYEHK